MPIYEYHATTDEHCEQCVARFEVVQSFDDKALTKCPSCGAPVGKIFSTISIHGQGSAGERLKNKNLAEKGFTKYVKSGDGYYEKAAGKGPDVIRR